MGRRAIPGPAMGFDQIAEQENGTLPAWTKGILVALGGLFGPLRLITLSVVGLAGALLVPQAKATTITEFLIPTASSYPIGICPGPDGALWFTESGVVAKIGRITTAGVITEFTVPTADSQPAGICPGPDGALWFTESNANKIGRITTAGSITEFPISEANSGPQGITSGPDGNLWFTEYVANKIGRITIAGVITAVDIPTANSLPHDIVSGLDGNLWFTEGSGNKIGSITPAGVITEFTVPTDASNPNGICLGPDGNLWFTESTGTTSKIGRITTAGAFTEYTLPVDYSGPIGIASGPDGNLWFVEANGNNIGRITTAGSITEFPIPTASSGPQRITSGPDGALWFTEYSYAGNQIGRISLALSFYTLTPCRALDTRGAPGPLGGPALAPNELRTFPFAGFVGACGIPSDAVAVSGNVTAVTPSAAGDFRVYPADHPTPLTSVINFKAGQTRANNALVALSLDGTQAIAIQNDGLVTVDALFDVNGYFK